MAGSTVQVDLFNDNKTSTPWKGDGNGSAYVAQVASAAQSANQTESVAPLGIAGAFIGAARAAAGAFFVVDSYSDQAGTLFVERSTNSAFTVPIPVNGVGGTAAAAGASINIKTPVTTGFYRARYVNGGVAQGVFNMASAYNAT